MCSIEYTARVYSQKVILEKLVEFERENGWMPEYHSLEWVEEFKAYIDSITSVNANSRNTYISIKNKLTKDRADQIRRWIQNEQVLCSIDAGY